LIFSTFKKTPPLEIKTTDSKIYRVYLVKPYYLGTAYLLMAKDIDKRPLKLLKENIVIFMVIGGVLFTALGLFLGNLFIKPMRESLQEKNRFIQDATHELNTPISTILANIELIEALDRCKDSREELKRMEIASKTLSRIYEDLAYITFNHKMHKRVQSIDFSQLIKERLLYFKSMIEAKELKLKSSIDSGVKINLDRNDAIRLIDNLISNAIKYNKSGGFLEVGLTQESFWVQDSGIGIKKRDIEKLFERFKRANSSEGGFGLGLSIVNAIVKEYNFTLTIDSKLDIGTKVTIKWKN
jgi:two-component system OmpR family sensor kinase